MPITTEEGQSRNRSRGWWGVVLLSGLVLMLAVPAGVLLHPLQFSARGHRYALAGEPVTPAQAAELRSFRAHYWSGLGCQAYLLRVGPVCYAWIWN
jgi:hypothetical protein